MAQVVERNMEALLKRKKENDKHRTTEGRIVDLVTHFTGSMAFVYIHLCLFGYRILWNSGVVGFKTFDSSLVVLTMFASVEAILLSTFVLISQNRIAALADKRANLGLQVSLLA